MLSILLRTRPESSWMSPILHYVQSGELPSDDGEVRKIGRKSAKYNLLSGKLHKMGKVTALLRCLGERGITLVLAKDHKVACNYHIDENISLTSY